MANIKCANCGQSISSKAPACPGCGHPNKQSAYLSVWQVVGGLAIGIGVIWYMASGGTNGSPSQDSPSQAADTAQVTESIFPSCTSDDAGNNFKDVFNNSQYARTMNLTAIDVIDQKKISGSTGGKKLVCQATLMLNNADKVPFTFTFTPAKNGQFYIEGEPIDNHSGQ